MAVIGGYVIIDCTGKDLESGATIKGAYEKIEGNLGKPILFQNYVPADGVTAQTSFVSGLNLDGTTYQCNMNLLYTITVSEDDEVLCTAN